MVAGLISYKRFSMTSSVDLPGKSLSGDGIFKRLKEENCLPRILSPGSHYTLTVTDQRKRSLDSKPGTKNKWRVNV